MLGAGKPEAGSGMPDADADGSVGLSNGDAKLVDMSCQTLFGSTNPCLGRGQSEHGSDVLSSFLRSPKPNAPKQDYSSKFREGACQSAAG